MTDTQTMIREVCERLGKALLTQKALEGVAVLEIDGTERRFRPDTDYNDCHLLIDWMVEAEWQWEYSTYSGMAAFWKGDSKEMAYEYEPDFRIAVLTAAWRALKDE